MIPAGLLDRPLATADASVVDLLEGQIARAAADRPDPLLSSVRGQVYSALRKGPPELAEIARKLHTTPRTLQRALASRSIRFAKLVDEVRYEMARRYLANQDYKLDAIASMLGFSQANTFIRAFKRWSGVTPAEYRRTL